MNANTRTRHAQREFNYETAQVWYGLESMALVAFIAILQICGGF